MEFTRKHTVALLSVVYITVLYGAYNALMVFGPMQTDILPMRELYRNVFFHVPINATTYVSFTITLIFSLLYLKTKNLRYDNIAASSAKLGILFCTFTLITGVVWAKPAWGAYWNWDPRETTGLILWFIFAAYFALRSAISDEEARARLSAVLGIFGSVGIPLTYFSTTLWFSLHPRLKDWSLAPEMRTVLMLMIFGTLALYAYLLWIEVKIKEVGG